MNHCNYCYIPVKAYEPCSRCGQIDVVHKPEVKLLPEQEILELRKRVEELEFDKAALKRLVDGLKRL